MIGNFKNKLIPASLLVISITALAACHTVEGTVHGAGQDINAVSNTIAKETAQPAHHNAKQYHKKTTYKKHITKRSANADAGDAPDTVEKSTTSTTSTTPNSTTTTNTQSTTTY